MIKFCRSAGLAAALLSASLVVADEAPPPDPDPWEGFNRGVFQFNEYLDRYALKPLAKGYQYVTPDLLERGITNFFNNMLDVRTLANNLFQLKLHDAGSDVARITMNTFFGLGGFVDVATPFGLERHVEDFGQTLGYWGVPPGNYLVLPLLGPSTVRDGIGIVPDFYMDPLNDLGDVRFRNTLWGLRIISTRADLLKAEALITGDRYLFIRDAYLQRREYQVNDGWLDTEFNPEDF